MTELNLDITGKVCPYCLLMVKKKMQELFSGDILIVKTDHPPAANETIPTYAKKENYNLESEMLEPGVWELRITKK